MSEFLTNFGLNYSCTPTVIPTMLPNVCAHRVQDLFIYNYLHNGFITSTNNKN